MKVCQLKEVKQDFDAPFNVPDQRSQKCVCLIANSYTDVQKKITPATQNDGPFN